MIEGNKVGREVAEKEIESWLDFKKVNEKKREAYKDNIDTLIDAVADGTLTLNDDKTFVQKLRFPIGEGDSIKTLSYKPRLKVSTVHVCLQGVKSTDADGRVCAYVSALTGTDRNIIKALDTEDYSVGQAIAIFFL